MLSTVVKKFYQTWSFVRATFEQDWKIGKNVCSDFTIFDSHFQIPTNSGAYQSIII